MILVCGATGMVGSEVCRRLARSGRPVRALVRSTAAAEKTEDLRAMGVELVAGDLRDASSLDLACRGVDAVITTVSSMPFSYQAGVNDIASTDLAGTERLIDAARAAGVRHLVYTSFSANIDVETPLGQAKRAVEAYLRSSGLVYTILRPSYFQQVWLSPAVGFDVAAGSVTVYGSGTAPISWISADDVAEFAVRSLDAPSARNATLELGGPEALNPLQVVALFEQATGRPIAVQLVPEAALDAQFQAAADPMQASFAGLMLAYAKGDPVPMTGILAEIPVALTSVEAYAARTVHPMAVPVG